MSGSSEPRDSRLHVARYQVEKLTPESATESETDAGQPSMEQRAQIVEIHLQQAMRRGDFDDLPGAGKPLTGLQNAYDPNWWIRQKIENERLTGLGPPALTLRTENAQLDARLDAAPSEDAVRHALLDFNARIIEARRQLQGRPPVVTRPRDVDAEIERWRERRDARYRAGAEARAREEKAFAALGWRERRRQRRQERRPGRPEAGEKTEP